MLEPGINLVIPDGWFLDDHPMSFDRGIIQIQTHSCCEDDAFEWDSEEEGLDDPNAVLVGRIGAMSSACPEQDNTHNIP